jgi:tetratricopeptide (TPR) repeat protein
MRVLKFLLVLMLGLLFSTSVSAQPASNRAAFSLPGNLGFEYQRRNNCGPVTAKMLLSLYGIRISQASIAAALKGTYNDKNVTVPELTNFLERQGLRTVRRWLLTPELLRRVLRAGFPVITHQTQSPKDDIGHFRVVHGFDAGGFIVGDSMFGPKVRYSDADFERMSRPYNAEFVMAFRPAQADRVAVLLGKDWALKSNLERLGARAQARVNVVPNDAFAWWGLGVSRLLRGLPEAAALAFDQSVRAGLPAKHFWYQQDALTAWNRAGEFEKTRRAARAALKGYPNSTEINLALAVALEGLGRKSEALEARRLAATEDSRADAAVRVGQGNR